MYYDPLLPHHHPGPMRFNQAHGLLPMYPDDARALFDAQVEQVGWRNLTTDGSGDARVRVSEVPMGRFLARELGDDSLYAKLQAYMEANAEPVWDKSTAEFTWGFGLSEDHPRGQPNAVAALAEAGGPGAWSDLLSQPKLRKFVEPTVYDVDFPKICLSQAAYDAERRLLVIATDSGTSEAAGDPTNFRVTNVAPDHCTVKIDGITSDDWRVVEGDLEISTTVGEHTFVIHCN